MRPRIAATTASGGMFKQVSHLRGAPRIRSAKANKPQLQWTFSDDQERAWNGTCAVEPSAETKGDFLVTVNLARSRKAAAT